MHKTRKRGGTRKSIKLRRSQKKIKTINEKITRLRIQARNIENRITSNTSNRALKKELKRKQGVILREIESLKANLTTERKWVNMLTMNNRESCENKNKGIFKNDKCYIKQPTGTTCSKKIYRDRDRRKEEPYCLLDELLSSMDDSSSMVFTDLIRQTNEFQPKLSQTTINQQRRSSSTKKILPRIPVLIRLQTSDTGYRHKFVYSSAMGNIITEPKNKVKEVKKWGRVGTAYDPFGSNPNIPGQYQPMRSMSTRQEQGFPKIDYSPQPGGPYAKFKPLDGSRWPDMPTWSKINEELTYLLQELFSKNKMISIPSATGAKGKDKKFLISGYTWLPLKFDNPYLEMYKSIEKYFTGIPYKFIIIPDSNSIGVVLDVKITGKMMSQEEAKIEMKKIQDADTKEKKRLAAMTPEERKTYENSISTKASRANAFLTSSCNSHLEAIKDILRSFGSGEGEMTSYDDTKNASLREKFMTDSEMKSTDNIIMTINELLASYNTVANAHVDDKPIDIYDYRINPTTKELSKTFSSNKIPSISDVKRPLNILNEFLKQALLSADAKFNFDSIKSRLTDIIDKEQLKIYNARNEKKAVNYFLFNINDMRNGKAFSYAGHKIPTLDDVKQMMREKKYLDQLQEKTDDTDDTDNTEDLSLPPPPSYQQLYPQLYTPSYPQTRQAIDPSTLRQLQSRAISKLFKSQPIISDKPAVDQRAQIRREIEKQKRKQKEFAEEEKKKEEARKRRTTQNNQKISRGGRKTRKKRR